jgi:ubiquitin-protein ligase E3 D
MPGPKPLIYAELLSNIRQISVIAALEAPCDAATKVELSGNGQQFILHHGGESTILNLPGRVAPKFQLQKPALGRTELSWRLPIDGPQTRPDAEEGQSNEAPWSAKSLGEDLEFLCRNCDAVIIRRGPIQTWKDLPSENWAEMMDFWHCHKPDVLEHERTHDHDSNGANGRGGIIDTENSVSTIKGYGANTKFAANSGTAFVDITTFLLTPSDCTGLGLLDTQVS